MNKSKLKRQDCIEPSTDDPIKEKSFLSKSERTLKVIQDKLSFKFYEFGDLGDEQKNLEDAARILC